MTKHYIPDGDTTHLGKAMKALLPKQRDFIFYLLEAGGNATQAARMAGYGGDSPSEALRDNACRVRGYQLSHDDKIIAAVREEAEKRLHSGALLAASVLMEIAADPGHKDRYKAAKDLLGHNGFNLISEHKVTVEHTDADDAALIGRIKRLAEGLGMDPRILLGQHGVVVDAEFEVVDIPSTPEPAREEKPSYGYVRKIAPPMSTEGLEDLLGD